MELADKLNCVLQSERDAEKRTIRIGQILIRARHDATLHTAWEKLVCRSGVVVSPEDVAASLAPTLSHAWKGYRPSAMDHLNRLPSDDDDINVIAGIP